MKPDLLTASLGQRIIWRLQYIALRLVETALQCFPIDTNLATARLAGTLMFHLDRTHRRRAIENLRAAFPGAGEAALRRTALGSFQHLVMVGAEVLCMPRLMQFNRLLDYVDISGCIEPFGHVTGGKPCLMITGHFGNWEMVGFAMAVMGFPPVSVARPLDNPYLNEYILGLRERTGQRIIAKRDMTPSVLAALDNARPVGFIADQDAGRRGFFVDFFGRKASAYKSIAYLALEQQVPIFVGGAVRTGSRFRYRIVQTDAIWPGEYSSSVDAAQAITQRYTAAIEKLVRMAPEQYLWVHRRWKTRPPEERRAAKA